MNIAPNTTLRGRVLRYGIAGGVATVLYAGVATLLVETALASPVVASALATGVTILFSYVVNRTWIFETDRSHASAFRRFLAASGLSMALNTGLMHVTVGVIGWHYWTGLVLATLIVPPTNFVVNQNWAFRRRA